MLKLGKVEKQSIGYEILKAYCGFVFNRIFYRKVVYKGIENIPKDKPVMFVPNHQNALMDPLALVFSAKRQIVFLARSDIFSGKLISRLLSFFKILPVYRIRDGKDKLQYNEQIFEKTVEVLMRNRAVGIFPEARHYDKRHLHILKKGVQRIIFLAAEKTNYEIDTQIVPVGIYYSNYWDFRSVLQVKYGKPISAKDFYERRKKDEQQAIIALRNRMSVEIKKLIIDIDDADNYEVYEHLREICDLSIMKEMGSKKFDQSEKFKADKEIIEIVETHSQNDTKGLSNLVNITETYTKALTEFNVDDNLFEKNTNKTKLVIYTFALLFGFPIWLYGTINNIIPLAIIAPIKKKIKDRQFESSFVYAVGIISYPILYFIQTFTVLLISGSWLWSGLYLICLPLSGLFAFEYFRLYKQLKSALRFLKLKSNSKYKVMLELRKQIIDTVVGLYKLSF